MYQLAPHAASCQVQHMTRMFPGNPCFMGFVCSYGLMVYVSFEHALGYGIGGNCTCMIHWSGPYVVPIEPLLAFGS
jgi:hypothetical protein